MTSRRNRKSKAQRKQANLRSNQQAKYEQIDFGRLGEPPEFDLGKPQPEIPSKIRAEVEEMAKQIDQSEAVERLKNLFTVLQAPPETVMEMLERLDIRYAIHEVAGTGASLSLEAGKWMIINVIDIEAGELRNAKQGNVLSRIYKNTNKGE
jgi:hypothetical protein